METGKERIHKPKRDYKKKNKYVFRKQKIDFWFIEKKYSKGLLTPGPFSFTNPKDVTAVIYEVGLKQ